MEEEGSAQKSGEIHGGQKNEKITGYMNLLQTLDGEYRISS